MKYYYVGLLFGSARLDQLLPNTAECKDGDTLSIGQLIASLVCIDEVQSPTAYVYIERLKKQ